MAGLVAGPNMHVANNTCEPFQVHPVVLGEKSKEFMKKQICLHEPFLTRNCNVVLEIGSFGITANQKHLLFVVSCTLVIDRDKPESLRPCVREFFRKYRNSNPNKNYLNVDHTHHILSSSHMTFEA